MAGKKILVACGTAIATATVVASKVKTLCKENGIECDVVQCKATEAAAKAETYRPDIIIGSTYIPGDTKGVPVVIGTAFLSGLKLEETKQKILEILKK